MQLFHLVYISRATKPFSVEELRELVDRSSWKNRERDITGMLMYSGGYFMQVLEGEEATLDQLLVEIANDARHCEVECLLRTTISKRIFSYWGMRLLDLGETTSIDLPRMRGLQQQVAGSAKARSAPAMMKYLREFCNQLPTSISQAAGEDLISNLPR